MAAATRIYVITNKDDQNIQAMIEATSQAQALAYMSRNLFDVEVASAKDVVEGYKQGLTVLVAGDNGADKDTTGELPLEPSTVQVDPPGVIPGVNLPPGVGPTAATA